MLSASLIQLEYVPKQWKSTFSYSRGGGHGRGLCGGLCCAGVCVRLLRACVGSCRPGGLEEKLAVFCCRGKDFGARGRSWVWSRSRILLSPTRTAYTSCPTFRTITPGTYQDACRCLDRTSLWCRSTHTVSWRAYFWTFPCLKYLAYLSCSSCSALHTLAAVSSASAIIAFASRATLPWFNHGRVRDTRSRRNRMRWGDSAVDPGRS